MSTKETMSLTRKTTSNGYDTYSGNPTPHTDNDPLVSQTIERGDGDPAPNQDWKPKRLGTSIPEGHMQLRPDVARDVCAALGIPPALYAGDDGGSAREGYRQLLTSTLEPYAAIIGAEFKGKIGYPVSLNFRRLAAADIAARARAYGTLVASGVDKEDAAQVAGLDL